MKTRTRLNDLLWLVAGALVMLAVMLGVLYLHGKQSPAGQLASKAKRLELVGRMRLTLAWASEAANDAVMAPTDQNLQSFADQSRAQMAAVERGRQELEGLLQKGGAKTERDLLARFTEHLAEFQRINDDLLGMAVQSTNLKAFRLAFGPAAEVVKEMDVALSRIVARSAESTSPQDGRVIQRADDARIRALRIQTLLPPHIAEESDQKMDELEAEMAREDQEIRKDFEGLVSLLKPAGNSDIETAMSRYARFNEIKAQIIKLSRENTNVRSVAIALNQKRKVTLMCQDALAALEQAIQQEPIAQAPVSPR
jgi:hypothetical protein